MWASERDLAVFAARLDCCSRSIFFFFFPLGIVFSSPRFVLLPKLRRSLPWKDRGIPNDLVLANSIYIGKWVLKRIQSSWKSKLRHKSWINICQVASKRYVLFFKRKYFWREVVSLKSYLIRWLRSQSVGWCSQKKNYIPRKASARRELEKQRSRESLRPNAIWFTI